MVYYLAYSTEVTIWLYEHRFLEGLIKVGIPS